jgi:hypothetical protein
VAPPFYFVKKGEGKVQAVVLTLALYILSFLCNIYEVNTHTSLSLSLGRRKQELAKIVILDI